MKRGSKPNGDLGATFPDRSSEGCRSPRAKVVLAMTDEGAVWAGHLQFLSISFPSFDNGTSSSHCTFVGISTKSESFFYSKLSLAKNAIRNDNEIVTFVLLLIADPLFNSFSSSERKKPYCLRLACGPGGGEGLRVMKKLAGGSSLGRSPEARGPHWGPLKGGTPTRLLSLGA